MKRKHCISFLIILSSALLSAWIYLTPRPLPYSQCSDLFLQYKDTPGVKAAFIKDFPLNDTLTVDVTVLTATDDEGWDALAGDFHIPPLPEFMQKKIDAGKDIVSIRLTPKIAPGQPMDTTDLLKNNVIGISRKNHTISIFNTDTEEQQDAVAHYNYRKSY